MQKLFRDALTCFVFAFFFILYVYIIYIQKKKDLKLLQKLRFSKLENLHLSLLELYFRAYRMKRFTARLKLQKLHHQPDPQ